eukprot:TRINITY_DN66784_c5_g1_i6.p1 TRINITY_DN66784_c5_g1~~TRINITY_DN66784_c5_g1_i6.p1  ORF type:complete len:333 (-),score=153.39 TRINITY_DN66784_c5_g1_i6:871-1869(-)
MTEANDIAALSGSVDLNALLPSSSPASDYGSALGIDSSSGRVDLGKIGQLQQSQSRHSAGQGYAAIDAAAFEDGSSGGRRRRQQQQQQRLAHQRAHSHGVGDGMFQALYGYKDKQREMQEQRQKSKYSMPEQLATKEDLEALVYPVLLGLGVAAVALTVRAMVNMSGKGKAASSALSKRFYEGGFEPEMTRREAALILGCRESATKERINDRYRTLMKLNHPDLGGSPFVATKINDAKTLLGKRARSEKESGGGGGGGGRRRGRRGFSSMSAQATLENQQQQQQQPKQQQQQQQQQQQKKTSLRPNRFGLGRRPIVHAARLTSLLNSFRNQS